MKKLVAGLVMGAILGAAVTAAASTTRTCYLKRGDGAVANASNTVCTVRVLAGRSNGFLCNVGGDYRARYGVLINDAEVAITQYTSFNGYRVITRKRQTSLP